MKILKIKITSAIIRNTFKNTKNGYFFLRKKTTKMFFQNINYKITKSSCDQNFNFYLNRYINAQEKNQSRLKNILTKN